MEQPTVSAQSHGGMLAGLVMYEVVGERQLLGVGQSAYDYYSKIASFHQLDLSAVPYELQTLLGPMLSVAPSARPSAISITGSQYFQVGAELIYTACSTTQIPLLLVRNGYVQPGIQDTCLFCIKAICQFAHIAGTGKPFTNAKALSFICVPQYLTADLH